MKTVRVCTLVSTLSLLGLLVSPPGAAGREHMTYRIAATSGGVLTGELVPLKGTRNQFRLVGHSGSFTAPAGTALEDLDGKAVEVELSRDGHVMRISPLLIHIEPVAHGYEVLSGQLVSQDATGRTFSIAGDTRVFNAPRTLDVRPYAGRMVAVRVDNQGHVMTVDPAERAADAPVSHSLRTCLFGSASFTNGSTICRESTIFRCTDGDWVNSGNGC